MLKAGETDLTVIEGNPRVVLRLHDTRPSICFSEGILNEQNTYGFTVVCLQ